MNQTRWIVCPNCALVLGGYNEDTERQRNRQNFPTWCRDCKTGVTPLYL